MFFVLLFVSGSLGAMNEFIVPKDLKKSTVPVNARTKEVCALCDELKECGDAITTQWQELDKYSKKIAKKKLSDTEFDAYVEKFEALKKTTVAFQKDFEKHVSDIKAVK